MKNRKKTIYCVAILLLASLATVQIAAGCKQETSLFIELDAHWKHNESGDAFVARVDVKNIGNYTAYCVRVKLEDIPKDWEVRPARYMICRLSPGDTAVKYFIIERGSADATIYASACASNARKVLSNKIAIPIFPEVLLLLGIVCGVVVYRDVKKRKNKQ